MGMQTSFRNQPPGRHLVVRDGDEELGVLEIRELGTGVLYVEAKDAGSTACSKEIEAPAPSPPPWSVVAAEALGREVGQEKKRILVWARESTGLLRAALHAAGWVVENEKDFVQRTLDDGIASPERHLGSLEFRSLAETGETLFLERLVLASTGDPFSNAADDPEGEWRMLVEYAGARFDPSRWVLLDDAQGPVGCLLPQATSDTEGTCFYLGVVPERRGEGWGRKLHALGLALLRAQGMETYIGSTDVTNGAMRRIFERNGCEVTGKQQFFAWRPPV